jgi:hypothetical protein
MIESSVAPEKMDAAPLPDIAIARNNGIRRK